MSRDILFLDVGDTLVRRRETVPQSVVAACRDLGIPVAPPPDLDARAATYYDAHRFDYCTREGIHRFVRLYLRNTLRLIGARGVSPAISEEIVARVDYTGTSHYSLFPETTRALRAARRVFRTVAAVSNWNVYLETFLKDIGLRDYFEFVVVSDVVGAWKPDPRIFRIALRRARARPENALYIGNSYHEDVLGARAAGIKPLLIVRNGAPPPDCPVFPDLLAAIAAAGKMRK
jgi:putative hydrolase of the HAD superfamily